MKVWTEAVIEEISFAETNHGDRPATPFDGDYTQEGYPYGANDRS